MIIFPYDFVATKYPGYFWDIRSRKLFSLKIDGVLKPLKGPYSPNRWNRMWEPSYIVSVNGRIRFLTMSYLKSLKQVDSLMPVRYD